MKDVLWGQYCVFLAMRIQDDLFDQHLTRTSLVWTSDELLLEARRVFAIHFEGSKRFWDFYVHAIGTTISAIREVDHAQSRTSPGYAEIIRSYPAICEVFKIATYAVCLELNRGNDFSKASKFIDEITTVGQTIDDLEDMVEDMKRGRINAAAAFLAPRAGGGVKGRTAAIARRLYYSDAPGELFRSFRLRIARAEEAIGFVKSPDIARFLASYRKSIDNFEDHIHHQRVRHIFRRFQAR